MRIIELDKDGLILYRSSIMEMLKENTYKFHYPDLEPDQAYIERRFESLKEHIDRDNTFFIAGIDQENLCGFIWVYYMDFMESKRMIINSFFINQDYRSRGLGQELMAYAETKAIKDGCKSIGTHYASFNDQAGNFYKKYGFKESRVEVVKKLL